AAVAPPVGPGQRPAPGSRGARRDPPERPRPPHVRPPDRSGYAGPRRLRPRPGAAAPLGHVRRVPNRPPRPLHSPMPGGGVVMTAKAKKPEKKFMLKVEAPANGKVGRATVRVLDEAGGVLGIDKGDLCSVRERDRLAARLAKESGVNAKKLLAALVEQWNGILS